MREIGQKTLFLTIFLQKIYSYKIVHPSNNRTPCKRVKKPKNVHPKILRTPCKLKKLSLILGCMLIRQAFFLYKTKKLSSGFSKTQIPKITENSVFAQKLSSKCIKNWVFREIFSQNQPKNLDFCPKPPKFLENSVPKTQKLSFSEISETWKA